MEKQVEFKIEKEILRGTLFTPKGKGPFPGVVFYHGRGSDRTRYLPMAERLSREGFITLAFDFRGCGKSDGIFVNQTHKMGVEDAIAGFEFLLKQDIDRKRIGIQGTSFGGYVTGMLLNEYNFISSVVLRVPASYSDNRLDTTVHVSEEKDFFKKKENWIDSSAYKGIGKFTGDLLVIESKNDERVSAEAVRKYYEDAGRARKRKLIVQNAGHSFDGNPEGLKLFQKMAVDWFLETIL